MCSGELEIGGEWFHGRPWQPGELVVLGCSRTRDVSSHPRIESLNALCKEWQLLTVLLLLSGWLTCLEQAQSDRLCSGSERGQQCCCHV